ncbi:hypothetical protein AERO9AM_20132 [Aeromicrobium sp. 9AM]|nr:hypothetical protein AERO9AM_20132 [Aeromicrobium sp. 9AM]
MPSESCADASRFPVRDFSNPGTTVRFRPYGEVRSGLDDLHDGLGDPSRKAGGLGVPPGGRRSWERPHEGARHHDAHVCQHDPESSVDTESAHRQPVQLRRQRVPHQ